MIRAGRWRWAFGAAGDLAADLYEIEGGAGDAGAGRRAFCDSVEMARADGSAIEAMVLDRAWGSCAGDRGGGGPWDLSPWPADRQLEFPLAILGGGNADVRAASDAWRGVG